MSIDWSLVVFFIPFITLGVALLALVLSILMHVRVKKIFRSANSSDIEKLLKLHTKTLEDFVQFKTGATEYMKSLDHRIKKKTMNASTVRFNPFQGEGVGGNQSFSVSLTDEEGNGVVITSMHTRERTNVFAKQLQNWGSEHKLGEEEREAILNSKSKV
ncbi:MAG: hypothetical protein A2644_03125 [Candidatus Zambryskibacteria bacterium RIFCSPHIGHO2_01_FULL_39_63]|nr:MAG: hypothetical protein UT61_C0019G0003 [Candidatus Woesebacteria bacterium GW2011_GWA1_39_8]OHA86666.1 MAG: hypothetical protein A2644_03125 [Candidatus Zambryskibacteria bacterium RIFCSPHIGHO2_01_FULL_39_63]OHA95240.1 MAG: hypothetical protein A3B88_02895 [Candidatus Zambryskibacteria bacterium RIFCSPHIGHO2_02_FULL_39_19]OHA98834.1 MAG: hypothetical protein A3F20_02165 [Candidatus Zambryskibacteria bacterium RIFCSPHIGHO2_12_FULL_39_21]